MKTILISDTHNQHNGLDIPDGDMIMHGGDFTSRGTKKEVEDFFAWFSELPHEYKVLIPGNHDIAMDPLRDDFDDEWYKNLLTKYNNIHYLNGSTVTINGIKIFGSPLTPRFGFGWAFNADRGASIDWAWSKIPDDTDIILVHGPPLGYGDLTVRGNIHVGCADLLRKVEEVKPRYCIFGHIHEGYGSYDNDDTTFLNVSVLNAYYQLVNKPVEINL